MAAEAEEAAGRARGAIQAASKPACPCSTSSISLATRAQIDTTTAGGRLVFGIFAALAEFEGELSRPRPLSGPYRLARRSHSRPGGCGASAP